MDEGPQYEYVRVADEIERRIGRGDWKFGSRLPGRGALAERLGESEMTVRRALRELERRGVVRVLPSSGAWVTWPGHTEGI
jgi:DNA-binding GntR family transcriptional regulator